jgi:hypothetical protein
MLLRSTKITMTMMMMTMMMIMIRRNIVTTIIKNGGGIITTKKVTGTIMIITRIRKKIGGKKRKQQEKIIDVKNLELKDVVVEITTETTRKRIRRQTIHKTKALVSEIETMIQKTNNNMKKNAIMIQEAITMMVAIAVTTVEIQIMEIVVEIVTTVTAAEATTAEIVEEKETEKTNSFNTSFS